MSLREGFREIRRDRSIFGSGQAVLVTFLDDEGNEWGGGPNDPRGIIRTVAQLTRSRDLRALRRDLRTIADNPDAYASI